VRHHPELLDLVDTQMLEGRAQGQGEGGATLRGREKAPDIFEWMSDRFSGRFAAFSEFADGSDRILPATHKVCRLVACLMGDLDDERAQDSSSASEGNLLAVNSPDRKSPPPSLLSSTQLMRHPSGISFADSRQLREHRPQVFSGGLMRHASSLLSPSNVAQRRGGKGGGEGGGGGGGGADGRLARCESVVMMMVQLRHSFSKVFSLATWYSVFTRATWYSIFTRATWYSEYSVFTRSLGYSR
jgi:hypothetical protein